MGIRVTHQRCHTILHQHPASHTIHRNHRNCISTSNTKSTPSNLCITKSGLEGPRKPNPGEETKEGEKRCSLIQTNPDPPQVSSMSPETGIDLQDRPECVCTDIINLINNSIVFTIVMILRFILINSLICKLIPI